MTHEFLDTYGNKLMDSFKQLKTKQERSYSEEDMKTAWDSSEQNMRFTFSSSVYKNITFKQWIQAFKKL